MSKIDDYFREQDRFTADMIAAYEAGEQPAEIAPYIQWKKGGARFSLQSLESMRGFLYRELDKELEEQTEIYLEAIVAELDNIIINYR